MARRRKRKAHIIEIPTTDLKKHWLIVDDTGVLHEGIGQEMVQGFCIMAGQSKYEVTPAQQRKFKPEWEGTLRLVKQVSCMEHDVTVPCKKRRRQKAAPEPKVEEEGFV